MTVATQMSVNVETIPQVMKESPRWLLWKKEWEKDKQKYTKPPVQPSGRYASTRDPETWSTFEECVKALEENKHGFAGLGFVLGDGLIGQDLDDCFDAQGNILPWAAKIVETMDTYTEYSPSDMGLHIIASGDLELEGQKNTKELDQGDVEVYTQDRYFTVTGKVYQDKDQVNERPVEFEAIRRQYHPDAYTEKRRPEKTRSQDVDLDQADEEIIEELQNSFRKDRFEELYYYGDLDAYNNDRSAADMALCKMIARCTPDPEQVDRIFRESAIHQDRPKEKWDVKHRSDGSTYGEMTIEKAYEYLLDDESEEAPQFNRTDVGNAQRLVYHNASEIRYCHHYKKWLYWDGGRWRLDHTLELERRAKETVRQMYSEASRLGEDQKRQEVAQFAMNSEARNRLQAMVDLARSEQEVVVTPEDLDRPTMLLNCLNGTINLENMVYYQHRKEDMLMSQAPVEYDPEATAPTWEAFLEKVLPDPELRAYIQSAVGYSLTGITREQAVFLLYGSGANGKSTFSETVMALLGDHYAAQADFSTFTVRKSETVRNDLAALKDARFVSASETKQGKNLDEVVIKQATGGEKITCRYLYGEYFSFKPKFKVWLSFNHKPTVKGTDHGIWRRLKPIPFTVQVPDEEQDKDLIAKLHQELPGILNWALEGCRNWLQNGLQEPKAVRQATADYREEMDVVEGYLKERCAHDTTQYVFHSDLYKDYQSWADENGEAALSNRELSAIMKEKGYSWDKKYSNKLRWNQLRLLEE